MARAERGDGHRLDKLRHKPWAVEVVGLRLMAELIPTLGVKSHEPT